MQDSSSTPSLSEVIALLESIAQFLELQGANPFKSRSYLKAARSLEQLQEPLPKLIEEGRLAEVEGVGKALEEKITTFITTGQLPYYEELRASFPPKIRELLELEGLGAKKTKLLYEKLGVGSISELERACQSGEVAQLDGFGEKSAAKLLHAILLHHKYQSVFLLDKVTLLAEPLKEALSAQKGVLACEYAGSYRRRKEQVGDLDFLVATEQPEEVMTFFLNYPMVEEVIMHGKTKSSVRLVGGLQSDLRAVLPGEFGAALLYFTGSKEHNIRLRGRALEQGYTLNEYRLAPINGADFSEAPAASEASNTSTSSKQAERGERKLELMDLSESSPALSVPLSQESEIYASLGLTWIPPELREDRGEIAAAQHNNLPALLRRSDLEGTFHCHTRASDGRNTLHEMAVAAAARGLHYLGVTDHSKSSVQAHGLDEKRLLAQIEEIRVWNEQHSEAVGCRLLAGTECDILKDGRLDFSDEILAQLDCVVASVHSSFSLPEKEMTDRIIRALENRYVTILGHLTGRLLGARQSYQLDIPAVLEAAAATGTWIEINASPRRLELDWRWWPQAKELGVGCTINPDAHALEGFDYLEYGVGIARKGWLSAEEVINTRTYEQLLPLLRQKRERR